MADAKMPYGDVKYADPGYQADKQKRYPIDTAEHCRAAWSYINQADNAAKYNPADLAKVKAAIMAAGKKYGVNFKGAAGSDAEDEDEGPETGKPDAEDIAEGAEPKRKSMRASASTLTHPPMEWFQNPGLTERTGLTITDEGQVFGHIAAWNECHRDFNECVLAPRSHMNYRPFHLGQVKTAQGDVVRAGKIVMDTKHAGERLDYAATAIHYDDTGDEIAVVRAGEDEFGIWVAGAIVPEATEKQVAKLRRSPISGDWRRVQGNLELVAALAVNVPAFPVYAMEGTERFSLIAAGMVMPPDEATSWTESDDLQFALESFNDKMTAAVEHDLNMARLQDLAEDEEIYAQRERAARFAALAAAPPAPAAPAPAAPPAPAPAPQAPGAAPVAAAPSNGDNLNPADTDAVIAAMNADGQYQVIANPEGEAGGGPTGAAAPAPAAPAPAAAPVAPAPAAAAPPVAQ